MIVVTAATGHLGRHVVEQLLEKVPADRLAVAVRSPEKAAAFAERGVEVRTLDYSRPETHADAFGEGDKVLFISGTDFGERPKQAAGLLDAAKAAGVALVAYTSILGGPETDIVLADDHIATERLLLDSGLPYVLLRNGWYHENYTEALGQAVAAGGVLTSAAEAGRVASAPRSDYAAAAVEVLTGEGHENRVYELSGDTAWSSEEYAAEVSRRLGRELPVNRVTPEAHLEILVGAGLPEAVASILVGVDEGISRGLLARRNGDLATLIGRPTAPIGDSIAEALESIA